MFRSLQGDAVVAPCDDVQIDTYLFYLGPAMLLLILIGGLLDRPRDNDTMGFSKKVTTLATACSGFFMYYIISEQIIDPDESVTEFTDWSEVFVDITENNGFVDKLVPTDASGPIITAMFFVTEYVFVFDGIVGALGLADRYLAVPINDMAWQVVALTIAAVHMPGVLVGNLAYLSLVVIAIVTSDIFGVGAFDTIGREIDKAVSGLETLLFAGLSSLEVGEFAANLIGSTAATGGHAAFGGILGTVGGVLQSFANGSPISSIINTRTISALFTWFGTVAHCQTNSNQIVNYATIASSLIHALSVSNGLCDGAVCTAGCDNQFADAVRAISGAPYFKWIMMAGTFFTSATGGILFHHSINTQADCTDNEPDNEDVDSRGATYDERDVEDYASGGEECASRGATGAVGEQTTLVLCQSDGPGQKLRLPKFRLAPVDNSCASSGPEPSNP